MWWHLLNSLINWKFWIWTQFNPKTNKCYYHPKNAQEKWFESLTNNLLMFPLRYCCNKSNKTAVKKKSPSSAIIGPYISFNSQALHFAQLYEIVVSGLVFQTYEKTSKWNLKYILRAGRLHSICVFDLPWVQRSISCDIFNFDRFYSYIKSF